MQSNVLAMESIHVICALLTTMNFCLATNSNTQDNVGKHLFFRCNIDWRYLKRWEKLLLSMPTHVNSACFFPKETFLLSLLWEMTASSIPFLCRTNEGQTYSIMIDFHKFPNKPTWGNISTSISLMRALCAQLNEILQSVMYFS